MGMTVPKQSGYHSAAADTTPGSMEKSFLGLLMQELGTPKGPSQCNSQNSNPVKHMPLLEDFMQA